MQQNEPKVIVDQEALNAPNPGQNVAEGNDESGHEDQPLIVDVNGVEVPLDGEEVPLAPESRVHLPGVTECEKAAVVRRQIQTSPKTGSVKSGAMSGMAKVFLALGFLIAALLVQQRMIGNSSEQLARLEETAIAAKQAADGAAKATSELSAKVGTLADTVGTFEAQVTAANNLAATTSETLANFSAVLLGDPKNPAAPGLLNEMLDEARRVRKTLASQNRELQEFHMEFQSREAQLADLNSRLDTLSVQAEESFREVRVVREAVNKPAKVNVTVGVQPSSKVVVDK